MANMSYLCGTNRKTTYPSFVCRRYDSDQQTIASDVWCVPLLWTSLFRSADLVCETFTNEGEEVYTEAPLVARLKGIRQMDEALPYFNRFFATADPKFAGRWQDLFSWITLLGDCPKCKKQHRITEFETA